ncbi:PE domain-containing protein [Mycobacterium sp. SM1]|nr:PE domain-containing protein [Mycobacterium sp. SM1]
MKRPTGLFSAGSDRRSSSGGDRDGAECGSAGRAGAAALVEALTVRPAAARASAARLITVVVPPAVDERFAQTATGLGAAGAEHAELAAQAAQQPDHSGPDGGAAGIGHATGHAATASSCLIGGDWR